MPLDLAVRMQINMALGKLKHMAHVEQFDDLVVPLLWTENVNLLYRVSHLLI